MRGGKERKERGEKDEEAPEKQGSHKKLSFEQTEPGLR